MTTTRRILVVLLPALFFACDLEEIDHDPPSEAEQTFPTRMAEAYCTTLFSCDAASTCTEWTIPYATESDCIDVEREALEQAGAKAREAGLTYDDDCVERWIAQYAEVGCDGHARLQKRFGEGFMAVGCQPYYGSIPEGEDPCFDVVGTELSDCGANLQCLDETCRAIESECDCPEGSLCGFNVGTHNCLPVVGIGDVCLLPDYTPAGACPGNAYCAVESDDDGMLVSALCVAGAPLGAACSNDPDCDSTECDEGICTPASPWLCAEHVAPRHFR